MIWDLAVVGAGPAGSICACSVLAENNANVALFDRETFPRDKSCGDAIHSDTFDVMENLGLADIFNDRPLIEKIDFNFPHKFKYLEKLLDPYGGQFYIVERKTFDNSLYDAAMTRGANDFTGCAVSDATYDAANGLWTISYTSAAGTDTNLQTRVLVGADGASSRVRRAAGLAFNGDKHLAVGIRAYAEVEGLKDSVLRIDYSDRFMPGYGWAFPITTNKYNIGVVLDQRDYKASRTKMEEHLQEYIEALSMNGAKFHNVDDFKAYPLPLADNAIPLVPGKGIALIGDAAAMIDPFTGEGIQFGICAGYALGKAIAKGLQYENLQKNLEDFVTRFKEKFSPVMYNSQQLRTTLRYQRIMLS